MIVPGSHAIKSLDPRTVERQGAQLSLLEVIEVAVPPSGSRTATVSLAPKVAQAKASRSDLVVMGSRS